jgi:hypothetical protein
MRPIRWRNNRATVDGLLLTLQHGEEYDLISHEDAGGNVVSIELDPSSKRVRDAAAYALADLAHTLQEVG